MLISLMNQEVWSVRFNNVRAWQLEWIAKANETVRAETSVVREYLEW